ncbi:MULTISPECIES: hypothetical protein [Streptomyces]|uniref:hypothetical protein n=1 Tax=Streptomyces TaxID=1883 RepID=UPI0019CFEB98|nr:MULTISPECIES: hypothetical protein [Streptomyces]
MERFATELAPFIDNGLLAVDAESLQVTDMGAPFADSIAISLASPAVVSRVHASNALITDLENDPVDRYDFSPIARESFGAGVSPVGRLRATEEAG